MAASDLCTLAQVKEFLDIGAATTSDALLARMITAASQSVLSYLQRPTFLSRAYTDSPTPSGGGSLYLSNWPVTAVSSVVVDGSLINASDGDSVGYVLDAWDGYGPGQQQAIIYVGGAFAARSRPSVAYTAGYLVAGEAHTVPATPYKVTVDAPQGAWAADGGVTTSAGVALAKVTGTPATGQYALTSTPGEYLFAAADTADAVLISYSYIPADVADAVISLVAERFKMKSRIGIKAKSMNAGVGETVSYDRSALPDYIKAALRPYRKVLPI